MSLTVGRRLGPYEIVSLLGAGGMGEVYRATDTVLKRQVALKVLPTNVAGDPERVARFQREAEVLAALNHPNIAHIHGLERADATLALVMELVEGPTLADRIAAGPIPMEEALALARQIAEALEGAHERGIIHRDLKPANIKVREDGTVKVLDFGLAKIADGSGLASGAAAGLTESPTITTPAMTAAGIILGTAAYMSPEQAKGRPADKRSDIWAFGCVLYEMLTGRRAFDGEDVSETLAAVLRGEPDWSVLPQDTPNATRTIVTGCLEKDRRERIAEIAVVKFLLKHSPPMPSPAARPTERAFVVVGAILIGIACAAAAWILKPAPATPHAAPVRFVVTPPSPSALLITSPFRDFALSPDGTRLAFVVGNNPFDAQLMIRALDELEATPVRGLANVASPFFSPDGRWIGFYNNATQQLMKIPAAGGPPSGICFIGASPTGATWTTDGRIVFGKGSGGGLFAVPESGGDPRVLTTPDPTRGDTRHVLPSALPDGDLVFTSITIGSPPSNRNVMFLDHVSGRQKVLVTGGGQPEYVRPGYLVYALGGSLRAVKFDIARHEIVGEPIAIVESVMTKAPGPSQGVTEFAVSPGGTLAYAPGGTIPTGNQILRTLVWVNRKGEETPLNAPPRPYVYARLSPDGGRIALDIRDQDQDIWVWDIARETMTRLTNDPALETSPLWTPDGRRIVFGSGVNGPVNLFWQVADGSGPAERLTTAGVNQVPHSITSDGSRVFFNQPGPQTSGDIWALPLDGKSQPQAIVQTAAIETNPDISPDGRWLAYQSNESNTNEVYVRPFPDVKAGRWKVSTDGGTSPRWARSGRELLYLDAKGSLTSVTMGPGQDLNPARPRKLLEPKYFTGGMGASARTYDVATDPSRFLMIRDTNPGQAPSTSMIVVLNWIEELKQRVPTR
jgi:serine/threonine-protein kinase